MPEQVINIVEIKNLKQLLVKNPNASIPLYNPGSGKVERILVADLVGGETVKVPWVIDQNYMIDEIAEFNNKIWKSLQDNNVGHQPYDDQTWWVEVSPSSANGTALQPWAAGIFNIVNSSVTVNNAGYLLNNSVTLPFNSTDFATELAANIWIPLGSSGASTSANLALTTPLAGADDQDELNIYLFNNLGGSDIAFSIAGGMNEIPFYPKKSQIFTSVTKDAAITDLRVGKNGATPTTIVFPYAVLTTDRLVFSLTYDQNLNVAFTLH